MCVASVALPLTKILGALLILYQAEYKTQQKKIAVGELPVFFFHHESILHVFV